MDTKTLSIFNQIKQFIPYDRFSYLVGQHQTDRSCKAFSTEKLLSSLLYAQIKGKNSLREIESCLFSHDYLNSKRSTLSYWNNYKSKSIVFEELFYCLLKDLESKNCDKKYSFQNKIHILDSTTISLSLGVFDWAKYRKRKWAIKLHISIDEHWYLPWLIIFSNGKVTDNNVAFDIVDNMKWWDIIVFDRWYVDYDLWNKINIENKFFVTRTKKNTDYCPIEDIPINQPNILYDKKVELIWLQVKHRWPYRIIRYHHTDNRTNEEKDYEYVTNNFELSAEEITQLYKNRRVIETFFRRIKQNLHIKSFLGSSENAVRNQIRIAMIYYLIMLYIAHQTKLARKNLLRLSELLSEFCMIEKSIIELLRIPKNIISRNKGSPYQFWLF